MNYMQECVQEDVLKLYVNGLGTPKLAQKIEQHLEECDTCLELADKLRSESDALLVGLKQLCLAESVEESSKLSSALESVSNLKEILQTADVASPDAFPAVEQIRDIQILRKLGEGGMGTVYHALHRRLDKPVAIKLLRSDRQQSPEAIDRFEREMRALGGLEHPNIVRALDAGEEHGTHFLVMEYIEGIDVAQLVKERGPLPIADACEIARQAALGLAHAHEYDKVHRDVKPGNLMLSIDGTVKVLDLGLASFCAPFVEGDDLTREGQIMGTHAYMPPEQYYGSKNVTAAADIYSLGVTLYHLLAGKLPLKPGQFATELPTLEKLRRGVPAELKLVIQSMLSPAIQGRINSMQEVARLLEPYTIGANLPRLLTNISHVDYVQQPSYSVNDSVIEAPPVQSMPVTHIPKTNRQLFEVPAISSTRFIDRLSPVALSRVAVASLAAAIVFVLAMIAFSSTPGNSISLRVYIDPQMEKYLPEDGLPLIRIDSPKPERISLFPGKSYHLIAGGTYELEDSNRFELRQDGERLWQLEVPSEGDLRLQIAPRFGLVYLNVWGDMDFVNKVLQMKGGLIARQQDSYTELKAGENELLAGEYQILSPVGMIGLKHAETNGLDKEFLTTFTVEPESTPALYVTTKFDHPWKRPELPLVAGSYATAHGALKYLNKKGVWIEQVYKLTLTLGTAALFKGKQHRWIEVEVQNKKENYTEIGTFLIDEELYRRKNEFDVGKGWIEADSGKIEQDLRVMYSENGPQKLTVEFDADKDTVQEFAERHSLTVPENRVSVQEVLALLFGANVSGGMSEDLRGLWEKIATDPEFSFDHITGGYGPLPCLVVSPTKPKTDNKPQEGESSTEDNKGDPSKPSYKLARSLDAPFSFVSVSANVPVFIDGKYKTLFDGSYNLRGYGFAETESYKSRESELREAAKQMLELSEPVIDTLALATPGDKVKYLLKLQEKETAELTIRFGDVDEENNWQHLEFVLRDLNYHRPEESASIWIDESKHRQFALFAPILENSFVKVGKYGFPLENTGASFVEDLAHLQSRRPQIGIYDALSLLFDATYPGATGIGKTRNDWPDFEDPVRNKIDRERVEHELRDGTRIEALRWQASYPQAFDPQTCEITRSYKIPGEIAKVEFQSKDGVKLTLDAVEFSKNSDSLFDDTDWSKLCNNTKSEVVKATSGDNRNCRLWHFRNGETLEVLSAEYIDAHQNTICLRLPGKDDKDDEIVYRKLHTLTKPVFGIADRKWLTDNVEVEGAFVSNTGHGKPKWKIHLSTELEPKDYDPDLFSKSDHDWVKLHNAAKNSHRDWPKYKSR